MSKRMTTMMTVAAAYGLAALTASDRPSNTRTAKKPKRPGAKIRPKRKSR